MTKQYSETLLSILHSIPVKPGRFPKIEEISIKLNLPKYKCSKLLRELNELGLLSRTGNWYGFIVEKPFDSLQFLKETKEKLENMSQEDFVKQVEETRAFEVTEKQAQDYIEALTEENRHDPIDIEMPKRFLSKPIKLEQFSILRWVMLIVGIGSAIISAYYTQIWQHETLNLFWSWFLSLIMIGFASAAFLTLIGLLTRSIYSKISTWLLAIVFFVLWIICMIYSVQASVAGRFNQYQEIMTKNSVNENAYTIDNVKKNNLLESIDSLKMERDNNQKRLNTLLKQAEDIQKGLEVKGETWLTIQSRILNVQGLIAESNIKIENKNMEYEKIIESVPIISSNESKFGFYDWMAKVYKTDRGNIEWIFLLFPSLFLDIASPIALAVFMFLGRRKENV